MISVYSKLKMDILVQKWIKRELLIDKIKIDYLANLCNLVDCYEYYS